ncbi:Uncharacterised protein [Serratia entomophila]|uniref:hypothetical protein n=1 Tax=Serratia entomophila TaxID=42906 RepID=UPI002179261E|nr:Uncharacterised protein [Serratia entomophila]CAI0840604.1 Uncharacterised protein [Serratia entomophila]CAI1537627.1 Uncharacterised protein [Serratia entomophila]CAI1559213.1 Uncharacterised protein [Serratia entomophila]CAI1582107.1 Uncharacterised protein [Serratia entomophila]
MATWLQRTRNALLLSLLCVSAGSWAAPLTLASKNFTEQRILSAITVQYYLTTTLAGEPAARAAAVENRSYICKSGFFK